MACLNTWVLLGLFWGACGITIYKECMPQSEWTLPWEGSHFDITFWSPEEPITQYELQNTDAPLWFELQFHGASVPEDYDRIFVLPKRTIIERIRNKVHKKTDHTYDEPMQTGWNNLVFSVQDIIEISYQSNGSRSLLATVSLDKKIEKIIVRGKYITINCHHLTTIWKVDGESKLTIPLSRSVKEHHLSLFSNLPTRPMIHLPSKEGLQLGWDGSNLADQTAYKVELQSPILASVEHNITISCTEASIVVCNILVGPSKKKIKSYDFAVLPRNISFTGASRDKILVFSYRPAPSYSRNPIIEENNNQGDGPSFKVAFGVVLGLLILVLSIAAIVGYFIYIKVYPKMRDNGDLAEMEGLLHPHSRKNKHKEIMDAIEYEDVGKFKTLWSEIGDKQLYEIQAHYMGKQKIIDEICLQKNTAMETKYDNHLVLNVLKKLQNAINEIFRAVGSGVYEGSSGVRSKLHDCHLPGSITDDKGRSILHHMINFKDNGQPVWKTKDISKFLRDEDYFINAVDHNGNTVLHALTESDGGSSEVLEEMATIFLEEGADPNIKNNQGDLPNQLARNRALTGLAKLLKQEQDDVNRKKTPDISPSFDSLVQAAKYGDTKQICNLLLQGVQLLPMEADKDPLVEAMRENKRDAVFLLISAGTPICNRSIEDLTPLEAAHNTNKIPTCYAAIIRKVLCDKLQSEKNSLKGQEVQLLNIIEKHIKSIKETGKEAEGIEEKTKRENVAYSKEVRNLLLASVKNGLSLTSLLLAQKDTYLHPLPGEESPFAAAINNRHYDIQLALCRDVDMVPFSRHGSEELPKNLLKDMFRRDIKSLENSSKSHHRGRLMNDSFFEQLKGFEKSPITKKLVSSTDFLYLIAELDLVAILNKIVIDVKDFDINQVVEDFSKSTLLHVASMYGSIRVIELLLFKGSSLNNLTIGNFTAAHLAAIGGHKECFHCIEAWMKNKSDNKDMINNGSDIDLIASKLMVKYEILCKNCPLPLLKHEEALCIKNEKKEKLKTFEILKTKGTKLGIENISKLETVAYGNRSSEEDMDTIGKKIKEVTEKICSADGFIKGTLVPTGPLVEKNEVLDISHVDFIYEIAEEETTLQEDGNSEESPTLVASEDNSDSRFIMCVKDSISKFEDSREIALSPPFLEIKNKGINIRWILKLEERIKLLTTYIVPTVKSGNDEQQFFYDRKQKQWYASTHTEDNKYFTELSEERRKLWLICRFLRKLTQSCWWTPSFKTQYYSEDWHTWNIGVEGLSETKMKTFFMQEETDSPLYDTLKSMYSKIANEVTLRNDEKCFVGGVIMYLTYLTIK